MVSFRIDALFLLAFFVFLGGVNGAVFQQSGYKQRPSVWSASMSPLDMLSLVKNLGSENTADVKGVKGCCMSEISSVTMFSELWDEVRGQLSHCKNVIIEDSVTRRKADDLTVDNVTISQIIICDESGSSSVLYNFSKTDKWCEKLPISVCPIPERPKCFLSNGTLAGSFNFGAGPGALKTELWNYRTRRGQVESSLDVLLTPDDCVPILLTQNDEDVATKATHFVGGSVFTNYTTWIPDPSVFTPPSYCYNKEEDETLIFGSQKFNDINALFK